MVVSCDDDPPPSGLLSTVGYVETPVGVQTPIIVLSPGALRNDPLSPAQVRWRSSDSRIVTVERRESGATFVVGHAPGRATLTATADGLGTTVPVRITAARVTNADVQLLNGAPKGVARNVRTLATYDDGSRHDASSIADVASSNPAVATIQRVEMGGESGVSLVGASPGTTSVVATIDGVQAPPVEVDVTDETLLSLYVDCGSCKIVTGIPIQFRATGYFSDGSSADLTDVVTWSSSAPAIASIEPSFGAGVVIARTSGSIEISGRLGEALGIGYVMVVEETPEAIAIEQWPLLPLMTNIPAGHDMRFEAIAVMENLPDYHATDFVLWSTSDPEIATVSNGRLDRGVLHARSPGSVTLYATLGSVVGSIDLVITDARIVSLELLGRRSSELYVGSKIGLTTVATFDDGSRLVLLDSARYTSSSPCLRVDPTGPGVRARAPGRGTVTVSHGSHSVSREFFVHRYSLDLSPWWQVTVGIGHTLQFEAAGRRGEYDPPVPLDDFVTWTSSDESIATISNDPGSRGLLTAHRYGRVRITASYDDPTTTGANDDGPTTLYVDVGVDYGMPTAIRIDWPSVVSTFPGQQLYPVVIGTYPNGVEVQAYFPDETWTSSDPNVVLVGAGGFPITAVAPGIATLTISSNGHSASIEVWVSPFTRLRIEPSNSTILYGTTPTFRAYGIDPYGNETDVTADVVWQSDQMLSISNDPLTIGTGTTLAVGEAFVIALLDGATSSRWPTVGQLSGTTTLSIDTGPLTALLFRSQPTTVTFNETWHGRVDARYSSGFERPTENAEISWASSDESVVSVMDSSMRAVGIGSATIFATLGSITASYEVTVLDP